MRPAVSPCDAPDPLPLARRRPRSLYVHLPFCARRCPYCDFATAGLRREAEARYLEALASEARARLSPEFRPRTVFLGGGTPAELTSAGIERLVEILRPWAGQAEEVTLEANPRTLLPRKLALLRAGLGVNRVSLGAQSFQPALLQTLGRFHRPEDVARAVDVAREAGVAQVSIDLIFAVPGQTPADLAADLAAAVRLAPDHVSAYGLTFEAGTPFQALRRAGSLRAQGERRQARLYRLVRRTLREAGFEHYEVSNFARPGARCRHNQGYWRNEASVGLGNSAASHLRGVRSVNLRDPEAYTRAALARGRAEAEREVLSPERKLRETVYLALRTSAGVSRGRVERDTGVDPLQAFAAEWRRLEALGLVRLEPERVRLTGRGVGLADAVAREVL